MSRSRECVVDVRWNINIGEPELPSIKFRRTTVVVVIIQHHVCSKGQKTISESDWRNSSAHVLQPDRFIRMRSLI